MAVLILLSLITLILLLVYTLILFTLCLIFTNFLILDIPVDISFGAQETFF